LDDISPAIILVGHHSTRDYKLFSPNENKVVINRDVQLMRVKVGTGIRIQIAQSW